MAPPNETKLVDELDIKQFDVLLGRGALCGCHVGSIALKVAVASKMKAYVMSPSHKAKTLLTLDLVHSVKQAGGRFLISMYNGRRVIRKGLIRDPDCWYEVNEKEARIKVREVFRDCIKSDQKVGHPSILLDKLGLSGLFNRDLIFVDVVEYISNSSSICEFMSARCDLIERSKQHHRPAGRHDKFDCGIQLRNVTSKNSRRALDSSLLPRGSVIDIQNHCVTQKQRCVLARPPSPLSPHSCIRTEQETKRMVDDNTAISGPYSVSTTHIERAQTLRLAHPLKIEDSDSVENYEIGAHFDHRDGGANDFLVLSSLYMSARNPPIDMSYNEEGTKQHKQKLTRQEYPSMTITGHDERFFGLPSPSAFASKIEEGSNFSLLNDDEANTADMIEKTIMLSQESNDELLDYCFSHICGAKN